MRSRVRVPPGPPAPAFSGTAPALLGIAPVLLGTAQCFLGDVQSGAHGAVWERVSMALRRSWVRIPLGPPAYSTAERPFLAFEAEGRFVFEQVES